LGAFSPGSGRDFFFSFVEKQPMSFTYAYPRPALTVDALIFSKGKSKVLLIQRRNPPFKDQWALPGGFVGMKETLEEAVERELFEETGLNDLRLEQFHAFSAPDRDPRHRTISVVFAGYANPEVSRPRAGDDAGDVQWFDVDKLPQLAFDHGKIIKMAINALK
jgi:8-oxo-dGTP diphosphatase